MKKILAYILVVFLAAQTLPVLVYEAIHQVSVLADNESTEVKEDVQKKAEKYCGQLFQSSHNLAGFLYTFSLQAPGKLLSGVKDVTGPPPDGYKFLS